MNICLWIQTHRFYSYECTRVSVHLEVFQPTFNSLHDEAGVSVHLEVFQPTFNSLHDEAAVTFLFFYFDGTSFTLTGADWKTSSNR